MKPYEILGEPPPLSATAEMRQERDAAIKAVKAFMFIQQSYGGRNPYPESSNAHRAFEFGMAIISLPCAEFVKSHNPAAPPPTAPAQTSASFSSCSLR